MATDSTGNYVCILLLDFSRAFDHIDHQLLLDKWSEPQVPPFMIHWKHSFLCDRQQRVKINNCVSDWKSPSGGTPQGTKSGARDFKKVVQDMQSQLPLYKYVDDTTLSDVCTRNSQSVVLQESANEIKEWCDKNKMIINTKKTKEIVINFLKTDINITQLELNGEKIEQVQSSKLLGVTIRHDLSWGEQCLNSNVLYFIHCIYFTVTVQLCRLQSLNKPLLFIIIIILLHYY